MEKLGTREETIMEYRPLVKYIARKIAAGLPASVELDDLISCGMIGLLDAFEKYDPARNNKFKTYAEFRIRGAMLDELREQDWAPRSVRKKQKEFANAKLKVEQSTGRKATTDEVRAELNISLEEYHSLKTEAQHKEVVSDEGLAHADIQNAEPGALADERTSLSFDVLQGRERDVALLVLKMEWKNEEVADLFGVSPSRISQILSAARKKLTTLAVYKGLKSQTELDDHFMEFDLT